jgi:protocatechuate 3,4-dioxygenase beta subunit
VLRAGQMLRAMTQADGSFVIRDVPPGNYTIVARSNTETGTPLTAVQPVAVMGGDVQVTLTPAPGVTLGGAVTLESRASPLPGFGGFRVTPDPVGGAIALGRGGRGGIPDERGHFTIADLMPGRYLLRATGPRGWTMKSVYLDGREVSDEAIEVKGDAVSGVNVVFTDRVTTIAGAVRDSRGTAAENVTVIVFADDERLWYPQSRHIQAARTDTNGAYRVTGLPPGRYHIIAVEDVEQGEWFDPAFLEQVRSGATRLALAEGEQKTQDLKAPS